MFDEGTSYQAQSIGKFFPHPRVSTSPIWQNLALSKILTSPLQGFQWSQCFDVWHVPAWHAVVGTSSDIWGVWRRRDKKHEMFHFGWTTGKSMKTTCSKCPRSRHSQQKHSRLEPSRLEPSRCLQLLSSASSSSRTFTLAISGNLHVFTTKGWAYMFDTCYLIHVIVLLTLSSWVHICLIHVI